ncbi:hypothetical protein GCM10009557_01780 [Virgisporangium ochraceum]
MAVLGVDRDASRRQRVDVAVHGAHGYLQFIGDLLGGELAPVLQKQENGQQSTGAHDVQPLELD